MNINLFVKLMVLFMKIPLFFKLQIFEPFSWLWLNDKQQYLNLFLRFGRALTDEEKEMVAQGPENLPEHLKERKPGLDDFKREIDYFMELYKKCDQLENEKIFLRWLRLDLRSFKQALLNTICKWTNLFKTYLVDHVNNQYVCFLCVIPHLYIRKRKLLSKFPPLSLLL